MLIIQCYNLSVSVHDTLIISASSFILLTWPSFSCLIFNFFGHLTDPILQSIKLIVGHVFSLHCQIDSCESLS